VDTTRHDLRRIEATVREIRFWVKLLGVLAVVGACLGVLSGLAFLVGVLRATQGL